jgi:hypothetical protein
LNMILFELVFRSSVSIKVTLSFERKKNVMEYMKYCTRVMLKRMDSCSKQIQSLRESNVIVKGYLLETVEFYA